MKPVDRRIPSYRVFRAEAAAIYGVELPLDPSPVQSWDAISDRMRRLAKADADMCLDAGKCLFELVRPLGCPAYPTEPQVLRTGAGRYVPMKIDFYVVQHDRPIFHFVNPRSDALSPQDRRALASLVHHAYARSDYEGAGVTVVELSRPRPKGPRAPHIIEVDEAEIISRDQLQDQIEEVYKLLEEFAAGPE